MSGTSDPKGWQVLVYIVICIAAALVGILLGIIGTELLEAALL